MNRAIAFLVGAGCACLMATPLLLGALCAALHVAAREADQRTAQALMRQLKPGITECARDGRTLNCKFTRRGHTRRIVIAVAKP